MYYILCVYITHYMIYTYCDIQVLYNIHYMYSVSSKTI